MLLRTSGEASAGRQEWRPFWVPIVAPAVEVENRRDYLFLFRIKHIPAAVEEFPL